MRQFLAMEPTNIPGNLGTAAPFPGSPARAKQTMDAPPNPLFRPHQGAQPRSASHGGHGELLMPCAAAAGRPFPSSRSRGARLEPPEALAAGAARRVPSPPLAEHPSGPRPARRWLCCHGEGFCATGDTKEAAFSRARLGCSANEEEESGTRACFLPSLLAGKGQNTSVDRSHSSALVPSLTHTSSQGHASVGTEQQLWGG